MSELRPASFRGVRFDVDSRSITVGRRIALHEYPQRDIPYGEDMGRKARRYRVDAFLIGPDYASRRDQLIAALERPGPGQLVHPDYGTLMVIVPDDAEITQTREEIGKAAFSLTFIEAGEAGQPSVVQDTSGALDAAADASIAAEVERFASSFNVSGSSALQEAAAKDIGSILADIADGVADAASFSPGDLVAMLPAPARMAMTLANTVIGGVMNLQLTGAIAADQWRRFNLSDLVGLERLQVLRRQDSDAGSKGGRQAQNRRSLDDLVQGVAAAVIVQGAARLDLASVEDGDRAREQITRVVDRVVYERDSGVDDLLAQRTVAVRHINATSVGLPRLTTVRLKQPMPALAVAYEQHGSLEQIEDLLSRNRVSHPGFMPAGRDISILLV